MVERLESRGINAGKRLWSCAKDRIAEEVEIEGVKRQLGGMSSHRYRRSALLPRILNFLL